MKKYNFCAGPALLPDEVLENTAKQILDYNGIGISLSGISHRSQEFFAIRDEAVALMKELLDIPKGYSVLYLGGGASTQFFMIPANFMIKKAAYIDTGHWAHKAIVEAKYYGEVEVIASSEDKNYSYFPKNYEIPSDADYLHITANNTVFGTENREDMDCPIPLVSDMSSDIMTRPVDISKYTCIYGGAQKNLSMAGVTFVIVKEDMLGRAPKGFGLMVDYRSHVEKGSIFNTPPVVPIYTLLEDLRWVKAHGGVKAMEKLAHQRARILYDEIDRNKLFRGIVKEEDRSLMNFTFVMNDEYKDLEKPFLDFAAERDIVNIKGHRRIGGFRASCYNAMPIEGVEALVKAMKDFEAQH